MIMSAVSRSARMARVAGFLCGGFSLAVFLTSPSAAQVPPRPDCWRVTKTEFDNHDTKGNPQAKSYVASAYYTETDVKNSAGGITRFFWACPAGTRDSTNYAGAVMSVWMLKTWGHTKDVESDAFTSVVTNIFNIDGDPIGGGVGAGYYFTPWGNNIVVGPFVAADWLKLSINQNFAGGQFLGTTSHWMVTTGVRAGVVTASNVLVYGLTGITWTNQDLNVHFATASTKNVTTPGFTLGGGAEFKPATWRLFGKPVSAFIQYQHTFSQTAHFNTPGSSPGFDYAFRRDDDTVRLGLNVYFSE